jgi:hypothetical protein
MRILRNTILHNKNEFRSQGRTKKMTCKVQIKPIKNNPLSAKLKAKKKALKANNPQSLKQKSNNNQ